MGEKYERNSLVANPQKLYKKESLSLNISEVSCFKIQMGSSLLNDCCKYLLTFYLSNKR